MDAVTTYGEIIKKTLSQFVGLKYVNVEVDNEIVVDEENDRYLVVSVGWDDVRRIHGCLIHIDVIGGKIRIQRDGTEDGIALDLENAGIPREDIGLGFHEPDVRQHTGYAVA